MSLKFDPEFGVVMEKMMSAMGNMPPKSPDIESRRKMFESVAGMMFTYPDSPDVKRSVHQIEGSNNRKIDVYSFINKKADPKTPGSGIIHSHGGGMIVGSVEMMSSLIAHQCQETGVSIFSVDYGLAPEHQGTSLVEDCYSALVWLSQNAEKFNVDSKRIAVMGESAGGGIAAGVALMARDKQLQPPLAKQILIYPMLDDRNLHEDKALSPFLSFWDYDDNAVGWTSLLGPDAGKEDADISHYAAPARAKSVAGLPSTYMDVGQLDLFHGEDIAYATRLTKENIEVEFHLYPGVPHAFEMFALDIGITKRASANRDAAMKSF